MTDSRTSRTPAGEAPAEQSLSSSTPANTSKRFRIAIASDLHAYNPADEGRSKAGAPSILSVGAPDDEKSTHVISRLIERIRDDSLTADILVCPGDFGDRASPSGIAYAWTQCRKLKAALGAHSLIGTAGNHDFLRQKPDGMGSLKEIDDFPLPAFNDRTQYWGWDFVISEGDAYRVIVLNTVAEHALDAEKDHGLIKKRTIKQISDALKKTSPKPIQLLVCHHPPHWHGEHDLGDDDIIKNGPQLLSALESHGYWLVIHGHKHNAKLSRAAGTALSPWVLGVSSLTAMLNYEGHVGVSANQFFILEFDLEYLSTGVWGGTGRAWNWAHDIGWQNSDPKWKRFGFGYFGQLPHLCQQIANSIKASGGSYITWDELLAQFPDLLYLSPGDIQHLGNFASLVVEPDGGRPSQIGVLQS